MSEIGDTTEIHIYKEIGRLEEKSEEFEDEVEDCEEGEEVVFSALVWLGRFTRAIFGK